MTPLDAQDDPFRPPEISIAVQCIHCGQEYESCRIQWRVETDENGQSHAFWSCPIEGCDGKGFGFDIFPVDPEYQDERGLMTWIDDEEDEEFEDDEPNKDRGESMN